MEGLRLQSQQVQEASNDCGYLINRVPLVLIRLHVSVYLPVRDRIAARRKQLRIRRQILSVANEQLTRDLSHQYDVEAEVVDERSATIFICAIIPLMGDIFAGLD